VRVGELIARGEVDLGFQHISEPTNFMGDYPGPLPAKIQTTTIWSAGMRGKSDAAEAASAFLQFFASPDARAAIMQSGMDPAT